MNKLFTYSYPDTIFEDDVKSIQLEMDATDSNELNIKTASINDLSNFIVTEMISTVKDDMKSINSFPL